MLTPAGVGDVPLAVQVLHHFSSVGSNASYELRMLKMKRVAAAKNIGGFVASIGSGKQVIELTAVNDEGRFSRAAPGSGFRRHVRHVAFSPMKQVFAETIGHDVVTALGFGVGRIVENPLCTHAHDKRVARIVAVNDHWIFGNTHPVEKID